MTRFMHFLERNSSLPPHPIQSASDHYLMLQGFWFDSTALSYGGEGAEKFSIDYEIFASSLRLCDSAVL